ncbi:uncharacterized protein LOC113463933 [Ceratina calcarata]|uniref:Uncharacterized protein LOC113463933 n=1 Tax=Ceratina calcarata TaxID=156304 RepID=A0AAJ7RXS4_9HYME|nr:uncharacterized protein LOC113463933 [Ceratina calcarata]
MTSVKRLQPFSGEPLDWSRFKQSFELATSLGNYSDKENVLRLSEDKLPKLDLPTFAGRYEDWENFCDLFTTLVHNAPRLADATKLQYLKSCLRGTAADLVKDVTTTNANYVTTWQALKARFHNPRLIVYNHLRALTDIPHVKRESASEMCALADESQQKRRVNVSLTGLGASSAGTARASTRLVVQSLIDPEVKFETDALIVKKVTSQLPARQLLEVDLDVFHGLPLADPQFYVPDSVDVILGADIYGRLLRAGVKTFPTSDLVAQDTALGWILSGSLSEEGSRRAATQEQDTLQAHHYAASEELEASLQRFWTVEELPALNASSDPQADIRDMFLKIKIREEDQDVQRFLWRGADRTKPPEEYVFTSVLFGAKSSPCTAIFIKNKNASQFLSKYPVTANSIIENCYMDDYLHSCRTVEEAAKCVSEAIEINKLANWETHSWASNHAEILNELCGGDSTSNLIKTVDSQNNDEKVLGLKWLNATDELAFRFNRDKISEDFYNGAKRPTKREFLGIIMSIFDPLGFLIPFTVQSRVLMQRIWVSGIGWDEPLHDDEFATWQHWLKGLDSVKNCKIDRCYQLKNQQTTFAELHIFCDASTKAYAAVAYWRLALSDDKFHVSIIAAKARVAPLKVVSIPRLELQAALLGVRLAKTISDEHDFKISKRAFWSDSKTVLSWIRKDPRDFKVFVANRLGEIRENSKVDEWKYINTKENPADDGTRSVTNALQQGSRWLQGPSFLREPENRWPEERSQVKCSEDLAECLRSETRVVCTVERGNWLVEFSRFSTYERLMKAVMCVIKVKDIFKKVKSRSSIKIKLEAEKVCVRVSQSISFHDEINAIKRSKTMPKNSKILPLNAFLDGDNILRVEGRLRHFDSDELDTQPIILDAKETFTQLVIKYHHEKFYHGSHEAVINELRQRFWIVGLRQGLKSLVSKCSICRMRRARPANPKMADLPPARLAFRLRPFSHCGVDYFGPMQVKIGRRREKRWGVLFTCLTTRAVFIELAHSLSTDSAIMAFRRFTSRRGTPVCVYSDNGTNFKGMDKELQQALKDINRSEIDSFAVENNIDWKFNPPTASHMGGAWERLIRSVKIALAIVLKEQAPKEEVMLTLLAEIEHSVNSRPLTHVSVDPRDAEALTPNHFLFGSSSGQIKISRCDAQSECTRQQWRVAQYFADAFWKRWLREYLPTLLPRKKWRETEMPMKVGDIVLILDNNVERNQWRKGVIVKVFSGTDGQVRVAEVRTANGIFKRPTRKLVKFAEVQTP